MSDAARHYRFSLDLVNALAVLLKTVRLHDVRNAAVVRQMEKIALLVNGTLPEDSILRVELVGEHFSVNDVRVKHTLEHRLTFDYLAAEFRTRKLGALVFSGSVSVYDLEALITAFLSSELSDDPFAAFCEAISGCPSLHAEGLRQIRDTGDTVRDARKAIKETYFNAVSFTKGVMQKLKEKEPVSMRHATKIIRSMVDFVLEEEQFMVGMTAIKDYDDYTYHHSVNVSVLSIALGQKAGLGKKGLTSLGLAAFFHDMGKIEVPYDILNKPSSFTEEEWASVRMHPVGGFRALARMKALDPVVISAAVASFEHHLHYDYSGYPRIQRTTGQDIYSRIISIADQYDALTSSRVYRRAAFPPDKALAILIKDSGKRIDPLLLKFFVNLLGIFPVGTFVMLSTNEFGIVCASNPLFADRPRVRVLVDSRGMRSDAVVDTAEKTPEGQFVRSIVKTVDPQPYCINLAEFLWGETSFSDPSPAGLSGFLMTGLGSGAVSSGNDEES